MRREPRPARDLSQTPGRLARQTTVAACEGLLAIEPLIVDAGEDLVEAARRAVHQPATRVIGVVDGGGRLVGVLPVLRLVEDIVARVAPEALMVGLTDIADVARFGHAVRDVTVADAMLPPATIAPEKSIAEAFRIMHARHLSGLYIVDHDGRPTGYLDLLELSLRYLDALEGTAQPPVSERTQQ